MKTTQAKHIKRCPQCSSKTGPDNPLHPDGSCDWCRGIGDYEG